ncbi:transcriptional regulator, AsnC family [Natronoarchaeum philippinense]|uniref:Transcriptional regulator, AsnC family n=1 Tax=Natronoarchaeum philippinense TaxID=558529 RepID=A0A285N146_NATPI|nr:AsnC family transcriptional regulator [Natronoarchaeum philippinense]SNZ03160.1 transcriptional regulator, AsnC family [Natronoarchaeum philippinense]
MRDLDETDMEILSLLTEDARRAYSSIGEEVGLSGPAVSDRVTRLEEAGIIDGFTVNVNRGQLRAGVPVFVQVETSTDEVEDVRERLHGADGVEHLFVTVEGEVWFYGRAEGQRVRQWIDGLLDGVPTTEYSVTLVDDLEWTPSLDGTEFAIACAECGNTVDSEGESARIDETVYHFCCSSCQSRFEERYQRLEEGA